MATPLIINCKWNNKTLIYWDYYFPQQSITPRPVVMPFNPQFYTFYGFNDNLTIKLDRSLWCDNFLLSTSFTTYILPRPEALSFDVISSGRVFFKGKPVHFHHNSKLILSWLKSIFINKQRLINMHSRKFEATKGWNF